MSFFPKLFAVLAACLVSAVLTHPALAQDAYVGSAACGQCHQKQFDTYVKFSKKAHSWQSIAVMLPKLKPQEVKQCFECHTTGYGKQGGFVSKEATPGLADVGCETCHGPGARHAQSGDPKQIKPKPSLEDCLACHNPQRVADFKFKPLVAAGAH